MDDRSRFVSSDLSFEMCIERKFLKYEKDFSMNLKSFCNKLERGFPIFSLNLTKYVNTGVRRSVCVCYNFD